jgi:UPF0755 protein
MHRAIIIRRSSLPAARGCERVPGSPMSPMQRWIVRCVAALAGVALLGAGALWWWLRQPLHLPVSPYAFDVRQGATLRSVARDLAGAGILAGEAPLVLLARATGKDRAIKAGNYEIAEGVTLPQLLDRLTQGEVTQVALTIVEGATFAELRALLAARTDVGRTVLDLPDAELMRRIGVPGASPEGWFFPDTYFFAAGAPDLAMLTRAHRLMRARLEAAWAKRAPGLPLKDPYDALILASIVEKESGRAADRPLVASVFVNRLRLGMRLQADPTVIYGLGAAFDGNLRRRDLEADTPYNTYVRSGLPPTPIALPGEASLAAVTQPPRTDYLYFVARGDGSSQFSTSLAEHNRAVAKFQLGPR